MSLAFNYSVKKYIQLARVFLSQRDLGHDAARLVGWPSSRDHNAYDVSCFDPLGALSSPRVIYERNLFANNAAWCWDPLRGTLLQGTAELVVCCSTQSFTTSSLDLFEKRHGLLLFVLLLLRLDLASDRASLEDPAPSRLVEHLVPRHACVCASLRGAENLGV